MLDVILYGFDGRGLLRLQERTFPSLRELARYFVSAENRSRWQWAEVVVESDDGQTQVVRYTDDALRGMIVASSLNPNLN